MRHQRCHERLFFKNKFAREQPIANTAYSINVGLCIDVVAKRHFGRHESRRSCYGVSTRELCVLREIVAGLDHAEIEHFDEVKFQPVSACINVGGFDIAVYQTAMVSLLK